MPAVEQLYSIERFAELTALAIPTVRRLIATGRLATVRPAGLRAVRIPDTEFRRLVSEGLRSDDRDGAA